MTENDLAGLQNAYDTLRDKHDIGPAIIKYSSRRATGGQIEFATTYRACHIITISSHMPYNEQLQTLAHEAAHAFCGYEEGHTERFWKVAEAFGCTRRGAPITAEMQRKRAARITHRYDCPACSLSITTKRKLKGIRYHKPCYEKGFKLPMVLFDSFRGIQKYSVDSDQFL